jgi:hypothetical protein
MQLKLGNIRSSKVIELNMRNYVTVALLVLFAAPVVGEDSQPLNFNRDIRPILSGKCFACHGPDSQNRDSDYRLDTSEGAFADLGGYAGIVPGKPEASELVLRITSDDPELRMPPGEHKNPLTQKEIDLLTRWITEGAAFSGHWAFKAVVRPQPPATAAEAKPIDQFIAAGLAEKKLTFAPEASPETLARRMYLDLTGLAPTIAELDAFLQAPDDRFEETIDRLMASPQFAERLAMDWLDVARFADTNGYSIDDHRDMWVWRDWVIDAFKSNMRYDEFVRQQIAGDLMENATDSQKIATGFLRNSMNTHEGGTIAEEYRVAAILDKVDAVSTAFMGLTMRCAQCHDHKYDPISQRDYYRFFAFFNATSETGSGGVNGNTNPAIAVGPLLQEQSSFRESCEARIASLQHVKAYPEELLGDARLKWEQETLAKAGPTSTAVETLTATKAEPAPPFPTPGPGKVPELSWIWANPQGAGEFAWFRKTFELTKVPAQAQLFVSCDNEAEIWINGKQLGINPDWRTPTVFDLGPLLVEGQNLIAVAGKDWEKGGSKAALMALAAFSDGSYLGTDASWSVSTKVEADWNQPGEPSGFEPASVVVPFGAEPYGDVFAKLGDAGEARQQIALIAVLRKPDSLRNREEQNLVAAEFAKANSDMSKLLVTINGEIDVLQKSIDSGMTSVMVMKDDASHRKTAMLERGQYDQPGEVVSAGIPSIFGSLPDSTPPNRMALANWLTDPSNPLTARVAVNRYWQLLFGTGLVKTSEDFGSQGEWPSHPELLDWLAADFVESGWDVRALIKTMMMSRTYRQSSNVNGQLLELDPYNRLYARAPRYRLSAEAIRDSELAIAGLLNQEIGGPSVFPPQPLGLWKEVSHFGYGGFFSAQHYFPDRDEQVYRRSLYTFWKRTSPPPVMTTFDAPTRETCTARRSLTNTPLQALVLMNAPQFVDASRGLAARMLRDEESIEAQISHGFRLATSREPSSEELVILTAAYQKQLAYFDASADRTASFLSGKVTVDNRSSSEKQNASDQSTSDPLTKANDSKFAAMSCVASLILNLDETITRE